MAKVDFLRTLSGCRFYRTYCEVQQDRAAPGGLGLARSPGRSVPDPAGVQAARNRLFKKYAAILAAIVCGSLLLILIVVPLWLVYAPFGKACLLSLPPMLLCAASWMAGAWWGCDKPLHVLMAVTVGLIPLRVLLVLGWAWLALAVPGMPVEAFFLALMFHWIIFASAEVGILLELNRLGANARAISPEVGPGGPIPRYRIDSGQVPGRADATLAQPDLPSQSPPANREPVGNVH